MPLGTEIRLGPDHIVLDGDRAPLPQKGHSPQFPAHVCFRQTAGWIKMPLGTKVGEGHNVLASATKRGTLSPPVFGPWRMSIVAKRSPISATAELLFFKDRLTLGDVTRSLSTVVPCLTQRPGSGDTL